MSDLSESVCTSLYECYMHAPEYTVIRLTQYSPLADALSTQIFLNN